jgi:hypothetical protein
MQTSQQLCFIATLAVALGLVIYGLMQIFKKEQASENDVQVVQRQIRGFAYLILAQVVMAAGMSLCSGIDLNAVHSVIRSVRE